MITNSQCWLRGNPKLCNQSECDKPTCTRLIKLDRLFSNPGISLPQRKQKSLIIRSGRNEIDRNSYKQLNSIKNNISDFVDSGRNLYIYSEGVGNGKTEWALKLIKAYFDIIWPTSKLEECRALFINVPKFLLDLKENISNKSERVEYIKDNILTCDIVVFDEIGAKENTTYELDHLLSYINSRILDNKTCIYTSNIKPSALSNYVGDRLSSRIVNMSVVIELKGKDMRGVE